MWDWVCLYLPRFRGPGRRPEASQRILSLNGYLQSLVIIRGPDNSQFQFQPLAFEESGICAVL